MSECQNLKIPILYIFFLLYYIFFPLGFDFKIDIFDTTIDYQLLMTF
jgi:hypothetical protein